MKHQYFHITGIFLILFFGAVYTNYAQDMSKAESLKQELKDVDDSSKILILNNLCWELRNSEIQQSIVYGTQAVELASYYKDFENLTKAYSFLGVAYRNIGNYTKAFDIYFKGLELAKKHKLLDQEGYAYINIGNLYLYQEYYDDANLYFKKGFAIAQKTDNKRILAYYYLNRGRIYLKTKNYTEALKHLEKALELRKETESSEDLAVCMKYIGDIYKEQEEYEYALKYYKESLDKLKNTSDIDLISDNFNRISNIYLKTGDHKQALYYAEKSLEMADRIGSKLRLRNANQSLLLVHKAKKDYKATIEFQDIVIKYNDSLFSQELNEKLSYIKFLDEKYEYDKKLSDMELKHQIEIHKQKQLRNISILSSIIMIIIVAVLIMFFRIRKRITENLKNKNIQIAKHKIKLENSLEEIRIANDKLKELNATKDKFFTIIAHDLKSPFNAIVNFSELLLLNYDQYDSKKHKELLKYIHQSSENTYKLLENLLLWSRSQIGILEFSPETENLFLISIETIDLLFHSANSKSITLSNDIPENIFVKTDKELYVTIIRNLITNAVKFTPKGGKVSIIAENIRNDGIERYTEISVIDEGIGISNEKIEKLFKITENISTKGTENEDGTGLGLILCKEFVEMHGGQIKIKSDVNKGTTISFTLPTA